MVGCPECGGSSAVQITRDGARPWQEEAGRSGARWAMRCEDCGAEWTLVD